MQVGGAQPKETLKDTSIHRKLGEYHWNRSEDESWLQNWGFIACTSKPIDDSWIKLRFVEAHPRSFRKSQCSSSWASGPKIHWIIKNLSLTAKSMMRNVQTIFPFLWVELLFTSMYEFWSNTKTTSDDRSMVFIVSIFKPLFEFHNASSSH